MVPTKQTLQTTSPPTRHEFLAEDVSLDDAALSVAEVREMALAEVDVEAFVGEAE